MRQLGNLKCVEKLVDHDGPWIVFFHGYGADANDLAPLSNVIASPEKANWLFPNAPIEVPIGPGWTGRAWWPLNLEAWMKAMEQGQEKDLAVLTPPGLHEARQNTFKALAQLKVPWSKIILGGFSQGAMLATDLYLNAPETPAGLVLLSGTLINSNEWKPLLKNREGQKFFQSHGKQDPVLTYTNAQRLESFLCQGGMKGNLQGFNGGHEIPMGVLQKCGEYLTGLNLL